ncbi:MAG: methyl-accepting chemotaxis protein [Desulfitobacteriaceae bacterium]
MFWQIITIFIVVILIISITAYYYIKKTKTFYQLILTIVDDEFCSNSSFIRYSGLRKDILEKIWKTKTDLSKYMNDVQVAYSQISAVSWQLSATLVENNAFTQELFVTTKEVTAINEKSQENVNSTINEVRSILALVESLNRNLDQMQETSKESHKIITNNLNDIAQIVSVFDDIQVTTRSTMESIHTLENSSKKISNILQTVNEIANNTHLLSLNASIESARAGEAGLGFGLVAQEIRKLADNSKEAVKEIQQLITRIPSEINTVAHAAEQNLKNVEQSVAFSRNINSYLKHIKNSYDQVEDEVKDIASISEEQFTVASNINKTLNQMDEITGKSAEQFNIIYQAVEKQKQNVEEIQNLGEHLIHSQKELANLAKLDQKSQAAISKTEVTTIANTTIELLKEKILLIPEFFTMEYNVHEKLLEKFLFNNSQIEAIWTNDSVGRFIYSSPPAQIVNANVRNWFTGAIVGKEFVSEVYISAITHNPCVTVSLPIIDSGNKCIGVLGADLKLLSTLL